jgi:hypothetical protein
MCLALALCLTLATGKPPTPPAPVPVQAMPKPLAPLTVVKVERVGPPPYRGSERLYRIEGDAVEQLVPGDILQLHRGKDRQVMPRLEVTAVMADHAMARLEFEGDTFPMVGDLVRGRGVPEPLPAVPALADLNLGPLPAPAKPALQAPGALGGFTSRQEALYFMPGESRISPAGLAKLAAWARDWGPEHRWFLACPQFPGESLDLASARVNLLKDELQRLGIPSPDLRIVLDQPPGKYPLIYVGADPW